MFIHMSQTNHVIVLAVKYGGELGSKSPNGPLNVNRKVLEDLFEF